MDGPQEVVARLEQCVPDLEAQLQEVDRFVGEGKDHAGKQLAYLPACSLDLSCAYYCTTTSHTY